MTPNHTTRVPAHSQKLGPNRPVPIDACKLNRAEALLNTLSERDRDVLRRWYCLEQDPERIQRETGISESGFRRLRANVRTWIRESS